MYVVGSRSSPLCPLDCFAIPKYDNENLAREFNGYQVGFGGDSPMSCG